MQHVRTLKFRLSGPTVLPYTEPLRSNVSAPCWNIYAYVTNNLRILNWAH